MSTSKVEDEMPQSVEEAGALLGATVIGYGSATFAVLNPPKGIHSSFATISPVPSSELLSRLHALRSLLRSAPKDTPLVAAPSLLAGVLLKLLGISSSLAANLSSSSSGSIDPTKRTDIPPMLSTPIRRVWVQCVVLCHSLGDGLSGNARINLYGFVRDMILLAGLNPRTARALGGTRVAALEVLGGLLEDAKLSSQLASWAFDIAQLCQRALKSSGNGEPSYRVAAVEAACSVAVASREAFLKTRSVGGSAQLVLKGALEDKAIFEMIKLLKVAVQDKVPEVRSCAARLACLLAPLSTNQHIKSPSAPDAQAASPTSSLEDIMTIAFKNLDDESVHVSGGWAEALARCMSTCIEFKNQSGNDRSVDESGKSGDNSLMARAGRKGVLPASACNTVQKAMKYLVSVFIKVGGESTAPRAGGSFSAGGRAMRVALARCLVQLLRLQLQIQALGDGRALSYKEAILIILSMVGSDMEAQLNPSDRPAPIAEQLDVTTVVTSGVAAAAAAMASQANQPGRALFGQGSKLSLADACVARLLTARVFREGLSELLPETTQISLLHELISLCRHKQGALKANQLQVILIEISHLCSALGEGAASSLEDLLPALDTCVRHSDHGVRHETAVLYAAISFTFPDEGRKIIRDMINSMQLEHAELMSVASSPGGGSSTDSSGGSSRFRFGRNAPAKEVKYDDSLKHQCAIHGMSLSVSLILRDLPNLPGGLPRDIVDSLMSVSEIFVSTLSNSVMRDGSPSGACTCVRAGFGLISGVLTTGPDAVSKQIALVFSLWQQVANTDHRSKRFTKDHEMMCMEALLTSVVGFLRYCSELLLSVPDALSRVSIILENLLPMFFGKGKFATKPANPIAAARFESAKASLLEAFAWLPPGSYPMVADSVFGFAAFHIQSSIQNDVVCSILPSLVSKEDEILDAVSFSRATRLGQVGGAKDLESDIIAVSSEFSFAGDRESACSFLVKRHEPQRHDECRVFLGSEVLGLYACERSPKPPTVLHEVGTWRTPANPSCNTKVRLVDAAIQAFASTFGLKSGKEQQKAIDILQSLLPPVYFQVGRSLGATDQERSGKSKDNLASTANIVAVLLSCVRALPMDESTHDIPVGLGPTWMNKASNLFLSILPSSHNEVRRAAAEGLGFLATLGVKEDMHFLQSSVLHSLDEIISGASSQGQGRNVVQEDVQAGRSGGLLTLACMQRNSYQIRERRNAKSRLRGSPGNSKDDSEDSLPIIQIMIRLLPYITGASSPGVSLTARTFALHAHLLLLEYSKVFKQTSLIDEDIHLLKKSVEIVEDNFLSAWTVASQMLDQGHDGGKVAFEPSFAAVVLRLMTFLVPYLYHLDEEKSEIGRRFSMMGIIIQECLGSHPVVQCESMAFFEVLADHQALLPPHSGGIKYDEHPILCVIPFMMDNITPEQTLAHPSGVWTASRGCRSSELCLRATVKVMRAMALSKILVAEWSDMKAISLLFSSLEDSLGSSHYTGEIFYRGVAAPRAAESIYSGDAVTGRDIADVVRFLLYLESESAKKPESILLRFLLLARSLVSGPSGAGDDDDEEEEYAITNTVTQVTKIANNRASLDCQPVFDFASPIRWQVKSLAVQTANIALVEIRRKSQQTGAKSLIESPNFNPKVAALELSKPRQTGSVSRSLLSLHISEVVTASCVAAIATVDQVDLRILQENAMHLLSAVVDSFGAIPDPNELNTSVLNEYVPQLSSCIKSALAAKDEDFNGMTCRLFWAGCEGLRCFMEAKVTDDKGVLKRIVRPVMLSKAEVPFFEADSAFPDLQSKNNATENSDNRSSLLVKIGKVWSVGNLPMEDPEVLAMLDADVTSLGVHSAAVALDGARLLLSNNMTLVGHPCKESTPAWAENEGGFFLFGDITEIDDFVKSALVKTWANCLQSAVKCLGKAIVASDTDASISEACSEWLKVVVPFAFAGIFDSLKTGSSESSISWARDIASTDVACSCLSAICILAETNELMELDEAWGGGVETLLIHLYEKMISPIVTSRSSGSGMAGLVAQASKLLEIVAVSSATSKEDFESSDFLLTILGPLDLLQRGEVDLSNALTNAIVSSCMTSMSKIMGQGNTSAGLVKAMISLVMSLSSREEKVPEMVRVASQELLRQCVAHESVVISDHSAICVKLASLRDWGTWSVVVKEKDGTAAEKSLIELEKALLNPSYTGEQLTSLAAIRGLTQTCAIPSPLVGRIVSALGAEILSVFKAYGTLSNNSSEVQTHRVTACADCMKISLAAYQQFSADCSEDPVSQFLAVLFEVFIAVIRFNGLPNHPAPQGALSDPSIGRLCAQAITHIARTTPVPFKACMGTLLSEQDRAVLEFAVRAEMSGYAAPAQAPAKKKLSLKGFKK